MDPSNHAQAVLFTCTLATTLAFRAQPARKALPVLLSPSSPTSEQRDAHFESFTAARRNQERQKHTIRPAPDGHRITHQWLLSLSDDDCENRFRFRIDEILQLIEVLEIPDTYHTRSRYRFTGLEAFCLLCARFRSAGDISELTIKYQRPHAAISELVNELVTDVDTRWGHLLGFDHTFLLSPARIAMYTEAVQRACDMLIRVWAFIDCTIRAICRPTYHQRQGYNGYKKLHALKFQALSLPDGMIGHLFGPIEGRRGDGYLLSESGLLDLCRAHACRPDAPVGAPEHEQFYHLFGDPAYGLNPVLVSPFSGPGDRTEEEAAFNECMSGLRIEVEHAFGKVLQLWPFLRARWKLRVYASPVGRYYRVGVLLTNAMNCLRPNQTSRYFQCKPPYLDEYFHH